MIENKILIHTSVKLVTQSVAIPGWIDEILIHTSVKLVTPQLRQERRFNSILIHTSVKLVTTTGCRLHLPERAF